MAQGGPAGSDPRRARLFTSQSHLLHSPETEWGRSGLIPCAETPARIEAIEKALRNHGWQLEESAPADRADLLSVHTEAYLEFLETAVQDWESAGYDLPVLAGTFSPRGVRPAGPPRSIQGKAGYYAFGLGSPILEGTWQAARGAAGVALDATRAVLDGADVALGLCRPPGHHAGTDYGGGYCYLNNAALGAEHIAGRTGRRGGVAIVDLDYHHGNGTQDIFWERDDVTYFSIHADPDFDYPYFTGRVEERGSGRGSGYTLNAPLPLGSGDGPWLTALDRGLAEIPPPETIVVSLGLDPLVGDERFAVTQQGFRAAGAKLAAAAPLVILIEGGYLVAELGNATVAFLEGALGSQPPQP